MIPPLMRKRKAMHRRAINSGISAAVIFSKRRPPSPRKLEPHEVIEKLKARKAARVSA